MTDIIANAPWWVYLMVFAWFYGALYYNQNKENLMEGKENGMFGLSKAQGETGGIEKESSGQDSGIEESMEVEASGDALVIADAIAGHAGSIHDLADAIRGYAKVMAAENGMDDGEVEDVYLDGTRK